MAKVKKCYAYYVKNNLLEEPFGIKAGEKFFRTADGVVSDTNKKLPSYINLEDDSTFNKVIWHPEFRPGVAVKYEQLNPAPGFPKLHFQKGEIVSVDKDYVNIKPYGSDTTVKVMFRSITIIQRYWFISSEGQIQNAEVGVNKAAEDYRKMTNNYFESKDAAIEARPIYIDALKGIRYK